MTSLMSEARFRRLSWRDLQSMGNLAQVGQSHNSGEIGGLSVTVKLVSAATSFTELINSADNESCDHIDVCRKVGVA